MSAPVIVTPRELVIADIARTAHRYGHESAARLLRRADLDAIDIAAVSRDLARSHAREARVAGDALDLLSAPLGTPRAAAMRLASWCGIELGEWVDETCREQGMTLSADEVLS